MPGRLYPGQPISWKWGDRAAQRQSWGFYEKPKTSIDKMVPPRYGYHPNYYVDPIRPTVQKTSLNLASPVRQSAKKVTKKADLALYETSEPLITQDDLYYQQPPNTDRTS